MGDPLDPTTLVGPLVSQAAVDTTAAAVAVAVEQGGEVLAGGKSVEGTGFFFEPTLDRWQANDPRLQKVDGTHRGYVAFTRSAKQLRADLVEVDDASHADSPSRVGSAWVVEAGSPAILPA